MTTRLQELQAALRGKLEENDAIAESFKTEDNGGIVVSAEQRDAFRANLRDAQEIKALIEMERSQSELKEFGESVAVAAAAAGSAGGQQVFGQQMSLKTLGEMFTESEEFKDLLTSGGYTMRNDWKVEGVDLGSMWVPVQEQKDVHTASGGVLSGIGFGRTQYDPLVPRQFRQSRVRDLFPVAVTNANLIDYFRVSGFTNNASPVAQRNAGNTAFAAKNQSALSFSPAQAPVRTIAHWEAAHRNVIADEPQLQSVINNELLYGLRLTEDYQILQGTGTGEDLLGILNTPGIQTHTQASVAGDTKVDALRRAATKVILSYYEPTGYVVHPYDWEDVELQKDSQGRYIVTTNVAIGAAATIWRQPVVDTPAMPEGTFLTGAFGLGAQLYDREVANIRIAEQHSDFFVRNAIVILAEERIALATKRPESFVKGTFTP